MRRRFQAVKGTRDILPPDSALWNRVEQTARRVLEAYNFHEIRLPLFEEYEVFARSVGADTDIVSKEMYVLEDRVPEQTRSLRNSLLHLDMEIARQNSVETYIQMLHDFRSTVIEAFEAGEIPKTKDNSAGIVWLSHLADRAKNLATIRDPEALSREWQVLHHDLIECLQDLQFTAPIALRPEATASVVRAYIEHGLHTRPGNVKLYYCGPMFRRERPQKGRYRQFYQLGAEVLGPSDHPAIDAEIIEMALVFLSRCGLPVALTPEPRLSFRTLASPGGEESPFPSRPRDGEGCTLFVNSIGCADCRPQYVALLRKELKKVKDRLGPDSQRRIDTNPLRVLDSKVEGEQPIIAKLPSIAEHLCAACRANFEAVQQELKDRGIAYTINPRLVRGLDYYVRTTFEITAPGLGAQNAVCGGGRYDGLIELLGGPPTKATGWALGTDRLVLALQQAGAGKAEAALDLMIVWMGQPAYARAREVAAKLRATGVAVELPYDEMKIRKALSRANQLSARYALIIGEDELKQGKLTLREMHSGTQRSLTESELLKELGQKQP